MLCSYTLRGGDLSRFGPLLEIRWLSLSHPTRLQHPRPMRGHGYGTLPRGRRGGIRAVDLVISNSCLAIEGP